MSYDSWKTTEPDVLPVSGEHRSFDVSCDCSECADADADGEMKCCPRFSWGDRTHDLNCDNYDGPKDGEAWSGGFAENH